MKLKEINCSVLGDYEPAQASECEEPINSDEILSFEDKYIGGAKAGAKGGAKTGGSKGMASLKRKIPADITSEMRDEIRKMVALSARRLGKDLYRELFEASEF